MAEITYEDRREDILARLLVVAESVDLDFEGRRNEPGLPDTRKYVVIFDGAEQAFGDPPPRRSANEPPPQIMRMTPEVQFRLAKSSKDIGPALNKLRINLIAKVTTDATLLGFSLNGRSIHVAGAGAATERGRTIEGGIGVAFNIDYLLRPGRQVG